MLCPLCADQTVISEISSFYLIRPELDTMKSTILLLVASLMIIVVSGRRGLLMRFNCVNTNIESGAVPEQYFTVFFFNFCPAEYNCPAKIYKWMQRLILIITFIDSIWRNTYFSFAPHWTYSLVFLCLPPSQYCKHPCECLTLLGNSACPLPS